MMDEYWNMILAVNQFSFVTNDILVSFWGVFCAKFVSHLFTVNAENLYAEENWFTIHQHRYHCRIDFNQNINSFVYFYICHNM